VLLVAASPSCGKGGGPSTPTQPPATAPPAPPPTTTPPATGNRPTLRFTTDRQAGQSPLAVGFSLCDSVDGGGGKNLTYLADFEEAGQFASQGGCGFTHQYRSGGVSVWETKLAVRDSATGLTAEGSVLIKTYVGVSITVDQTPCTRISATARLVPAFHAGRLAPIDRVLFEAFNAGGNRISQQEGRPRNASEWTTGTWNVTDTGKVRVRATVFANRVAGDDTPEQTRPGCGS
jgi:hypothetical protein